MADGGDVVERLTAVLAANGFTALAAEGRRRQPAETDDSETEVALALEFLAVVEAHLVVEALCLDELTTDERLHPEGPGAVAFVEPAAEDQLAVETAVVAEIQPLSGRDRDQLRTVCAQIRAAVRGLRDVVAPDQTNPDT